MSYRYRSPVRRWLRRKLRRLTAKDLVAPAIAALLLAAVAGHAATSHAAASQPQASQTATPLASVTAAVIAFAQAREGCPYVWGGTGPCADGYDCSGLAMDAYAAAGISIPRTSQDQWTAGPQVSTPAAGDLVFFAGSDGTPAAPGHVGIVTGPNTMIDAYATGWNVQQQSFGLPTSWEGVQAVVGYTDPAAGVPS
jgi:cell wall-associated NlpC family hydrolase